MDNYEFSNRILELESSMYRIAKSILSRDADCGDAMQNAILQAYQHLPQLKEKESFRTWLFRILVNECYQLLRSRKRTEERQEVLEQAEGIGQPEREHVEYSELYLAIAELEEGYRVPFVMFYVEGFSIKEIGKILHLSETAVKTRLHRGRQALRKKLKGVYGYYDK